jgi:4-amino-4-deoxy-L-arabinose transferase-like glycosyltransferase
MKKKAQNQTSTAFANPAGTERRTALWLFLAVAAFYLLCSSGHIYTPDGVIMYRVTESLIEEGNTDIAKLDAIPGFGGTEVRRGAAQPKFYAKYGLGLSLAAAPGYLTGKALTTIAGKTEQDLFTRPLFYNSSRSGFEAALTSFTAGWTNSLITAAIVMLVFLCCTNLGFSRRAALWTAIVAAVATPLWHYAKTFFSEPLAALALIGFFYFIRRGRVLDTSRWFWAIAGLSFGIMILTKVFLIILLPAALVLIVAYCRRTPFSWWRQRLLLFGGGSVIPALLMGLYNYARFTRFTETGYGGEVNSWLNPFFEGLAGLLISPGRGLILYCPIVLLSFFALFRLRKQHTAEILFITLSTITLIVGYAKWYMWEGGWCWGPRFLVPVIPLLIIPLAGLFEPAKIDKQRRILLYGILAICLIVSLNGIVTNYFDYYLELKTYHKQHVAEYAAAGFEDFKAVQRWDWRHAPIRVFWNYPHNNYLFVTKAVQSPGLFLALYGCFALLFLVSGYKLLNQFKPA